MGVLPLQFASGDTHESLGLKGDETYSITCIPEAVASGGPVQVSAVSHKGKKIEFKVTARIDTPQEAEYYRHGGILPYVLRQLIANDNDPAIA